MCNFLSVRKRSVLCHEESFSSQDEPPDADSRGYLVHEKGVQPTMPTNVLSVDSLVDVATSDGPFRGLRGTIRQVDTIEALPDEPFCFYLVALEGAQIKEPVWFECEEVEPAAALSVAPQLGE
jgi:hypothetical protein